MDRAEIIWEKGTNRKMFLEGEVNKYEWFDVGLSFYPSEITAAFLWAQLQNLLKINEDRVKTFNYYYEALKDVPQIELPKVEEYAKHNAHLFFFKTENREKRNLLLQELKKNGIGAAFHYLALHLSPFAKNAETTKLENAEMWAEGLVRIPLYFGLSDAEKEMVVSQIKRTVQTW